MNKNMAEANKSHMDSSSGVRSASDMGDSIPEKGWGAVEDIPGVGSMSGGAPMRTSADRGVDVGGPVGGAPIPTGAGGGIPPITTLIDIGEPPGETTGAGLRSAVGSSPKT